MMNRIFWLLQTVCLFLATVVSAADKRDTIKIAGRIAPEIQIDLVKVTYCDSYYGYSHFRAEAPTKEKAVINGEFDFELTTDSAYSYVMFEFIGKDKRLPAVRQLSWLRFFTRAGTDITIHISDSCMFDGEGGELFDVQYRLESVKQAFAPEYQSIDQVLQKVAAEKPTEVKEVYIDFLKATRKVNVRLLRHVSDFVDAVTGLSDTERIVVKANERYKLANDLLRGFVFQSSLGRYVNDRRLREAIRDYYWIALPTEVDANGSAWPWKLSWAFIDFTYFNTIAGLALPLQAADPTARVTFPELYEHIVVTYSTEVRDRALAVAFLNFGAKKEIPNRYYQRALNVISDQETAELIQTLALERGKGMAGFPFRLPDTTGRHISFRDFRGKVVILDFWFTGCHGCISLAKAMRPVHEYFKDNPDVVFVNISIDADKERWIESVRSGVYDYPGSIALFTAGRADNDDVIRHYTITAYPTLIIFDQEGKIANFNPRGPYSEAERDEFIEHIEQLL